MLELFNSYRAEAQHISSVLLALAIWRWGAGPERWMVGIFIAAMVMPVYLFDALGIDLRAIGSGANVYVLIDVLAGTGFALVALKANRNYPLFVAGFQMVAIATHGVEALIGSISPIAYLIMVVGPSYCQLLLIFFGFARHQFRERQFGPYREWRVPLPGAG